MDTIHIVLSFERIGSCLRLFEIGDTSTLLGLKKFFNKQRRTAAEQEVLALIAPLGKLIVTQ